MEQKRMKEYIAFESNLVMIRKPIWQVPKKG